MATFATPFSQSGALSQSFSQRAVSALSPTPSPSPVCLALFGYVVVVCLSVCLCDRLHSLLIFAKFILLARQVRGKRQGQGWSWSWGWGWAGLPWFGLAPCCYHVTYVHQRPMFVYADYAVSKEQHNEKGGGREREEEDDGDLLRRFMLTRPRLIGK